MQCNICGNTHFVDMRSRANVKCSRCRSLERTRLLWLYIERLQLNKNSRVLHLAPEQGIYQKLSQIVTKENYTLTDFEPGNFDFIEHCEFLDLCDLDTQTSDQYDLILHSHVLEHTPCNIAYTLFHLHRMLKPTGTHLCVIPFLDGKYDECFQPLGRKESFRRFGQHDHVRRFGNEDIATHLGAVLNVPDHYDARNDFSEDTLRQCNIPENHWTGFHIGTVLALGKYDMKFLPKKGNVLQIIKQMFNV